MFRVVSDPSSGSPELYFTEITLSGSQIFFLCLVGVWQRNFEPAVCVNGTTGWELVPSPSYRTHSLSNVSSATNYDLFWKVKNVCSYNPRSCFIVPDQSCGVVSRV